MEKFFDIVINAVMGFVIGCLITLGAYALLLSVARADVVTIEQAVEAAAERHDIDPLIVKAIIQVESSWNPEAVGSIGEVGLMQLRPEFHDCATFDIVGNIECGVRYLAYVKERCEPDYGAAWFNCFNHGPYRRVQKPRQFPYYLKVQEVMARG